MKHIFVSKKGLKITIMIFLLFNIINVNASEYTDWDTVKPNVNEELIESERRCRWYQEGGVINEEYLIKEKIGNKIVDLNDYYYTNWSEFSYTLPENYEERKLDKTVERSVFYDRNINDIFIWYFTNDDLLVSEIDVYDVLTNEVLDVKQYDEYVNQYDTIFITDDDYGTYYSLNDKRIMFNLNGEFDVSKYGIKIYYKKLGVDPIGFYYWYTKYANFGTFKKKVEIFDECTDDCILDLKYDSSFENQTSFASTKYRYKDKVYRTYEIEKNYLDGYFSYVDNYIIDENDCNIYYRYKVEEAISNEETISNEEIIANEENIISNINIANPQTIDNIYLFIILFIIFSNLLLIILKKCRKM